MSGTSRVSRRVWAAATLLLAGLAVLPVTQARAAADPVTVWMTQSSFAYSPPKVTIDPGTTVEWKVADGDHTATSYGAEFDSEDRGPSSPVYRHTFNRPGRYPYRCQFHELRGMKGEIEVRDPTGATTTTEPPTTTTTLPPYTTTTTGATSTTATTRPPTTTATTLETTTSVPPEPTTTAPAAPDPAPTTRSTVKGSSSTTAPAAKGRGPSAVAPVAPPSVTKPPPGTGTTATPPPSQLSSTTSTEMAVGPDSGAVSPAPLAAQDQEGKADRAAPAIDEQKSDRGDLHRVLAVAGLAAVGGGGYGLRRWLPRLRR